MKIAITGASGHIGVNLCRRLVKDNHQIKALVRNDRRGLESLPIDFVVGSLEDSGSLEKLTQDVDVVYHLAAKISIDGDPDGSVHRINVIGTKAVVEACIKNKVKRLIHFSSIHAFDLENAGETLDENSPKIEGLGFAYDNSKHAGELEALKAIKHGIEVIIINPTSVVGPNDYKPSLVGQTMINLYHGKMPGLIHGGFDWVDVRDIAEASVNALKMGRSGELYLLSGKWQPIGQIAQLVAQHSEKKPPAIIFPLWLAYMAIPFLKIWSKMSRQPPLFTRESLAAISQSHRNISSRKAEEELGFSARPLEETIRDTMDWMKGAEMIE